MNFTKAELYEIERAFDERAAHVVENTVQCASLRPPFVERVFDEAIDSFSAFRTISAKAARMRDGPVEIKGRNQIDGEVAFIFFMLGVIIVSLIWFVVSRVLTLRVTL